MNGSSEAVIFQQLTLGGRINLFYPPTERLTMARFYVSKRPGQLDHEEIDSRANV